MVGPSRAAVNRLERIQLALYDHGAMGVRQIIGSLSEPMSRNDADSAIRRLRGSGCVERQRNGLFHLTVHGARSAERLIAEGKGY